MSTNVFFCRCGHRTSLPLSSWRRGSYSTATQVHIQTTTLMLFSPTKPEIRYLYDLNLQKITRQLPLSSIPGRPLVGSSHGFVFSVDEGADIHATNATTGASLPMPPPPPSWASPASSATPFATPSPTTSEESAAAAAAAATLLLQDSKTETIYDMRRNNYHKAILCPSLDTVVVINGIDCPASMAFARCGDSSWTPIPVGSSPSSPPHFYDAIFRSDGSLLCAVDYYGTLFIFDLSVVPQRAPPSSPTKDRRATSGIALGRGTWWSRRMEGASSCYKGRRRIRHWIMNSGVAQGPRSLRCLSSTQVIVVEIIQPHEIILGFS